MSKNYAMPLAGTDPMLERAEFVDNLATSTWYDVRDKLFSDIWGITPLLDMLQAKGNIKARMPVGRYFEIPIGYAKADQNQKWFGKGETFDEGTKELWTNLQYVPKNLGDSIVRFWDDERRNKGKAQIFNYVEQLITNHKMTLEETLQNALWAASPADKAITSLPVLFPNDPTTGTIGGIDRSKNIYLRNQTVNYDSNFGTVADDLLPAMTQMYHTCSKMKGKGRNSPDIIITTQALYEEYEDQARNLGQIQLGSNNGTQRADLGFGGLTFKGAELYWDPDCPDTTMYFLNSDTLEFAYDPDAYMTMTEWKKKHNSLDRYAQIVTVCQLCANNFAKNGVLHTISGT